MKMRSLGISAISLALTGIVIGNAYYQKKQFYPSVVYITKSNPSMAVIYVQSLVFVLMLGKLMRKVFLGTLRAAEFEHLMERFWYALTETCLAFTVFRDDFNPKFVALFTVLLFLKSFHWLAEERVDYMERSPVIGAIFHIRVSALLTVLGILDYLMISHAYYSTISKGATVQLVFGFEYAILITMIANITIKYVLHAAELRTDNPWENKAVFLLYTELVIGFIRVVLYVLFVAIMVRIYTLPLFAFRPMYYTMRNFKKALNDVILSRRAIQNMNTLYPDATPEELTMSDNICIICREDMVNTSKKLPCGHIFHTACLRSWFQRQQTCPTCRLNILRTTTTQPDRAAGEINLNNNNNANNNVHQPNINTPNINNPNAQNNNVQQDFTNPFAGLFNPQQNNMNVQSVFGSNISFNPFLLPTFPAVIPPPIPPVNLFFPPPPTIPDGLGELSIEELHALEGTERRHVEERIKLLKNIQLLMNASIALMNQYSVIASRYPLPTTQQTESSQGAQASTSTSSNENVKNPKKIPGDSETKANASTKNTVDNVLNIDSTSKIVINDNDKENVATVEDIGSEDTSIDKDLETDSASELRRRRLQKFLNNEAEKLD